MNEEEKNSAKLLIRDILTSVIIVVIILGGLYLYTGLWPPMVVIESKSMSHGDGNPPDSQIGVIDTGDLVLVKKVNDRHEIITYVEGKKTGYMAYGDYGDVIIYRKNNMRDTPVIHRAVMYIEYNATSGNWDIPDIGVRNVTHYNLTDYGYNKDTITVWFDKLQFQASDGEKHGGFITMGDYNAAHANSDMNAYDQALGGLVDANGRRVEPVETSWIVGVARGEVPWFGIIKLSTGPHPEPFPENSVTYLIVSLILIFTVPFAIEFTVHLINKKKGSKKGSNANSEMDMTSSRHNRKKERKKNKR